MDASKPAPEVAKLDYFVGNWMVEGTIFAGPWGSGGKFSWTERTEWMSGKFFVVGHWDFTMPAELGGEGEELFVMGYDARRSVYTFDAFSSQGLHQVSTGHLDGDTWIWDSEGIQAGQPAMQRLTMRMLSPTGYTLKFEISSDGLKISAFLYGRSIPARDLDVARARAMDLNVDSDHQLARKTNGNGLPGYKAGWFRMANGDKALAFITDDSRVVCIPTRQDYTVLLSVENPQEFLRVLRGTIR